MDHFCSSVSTQNKCSHLISLQAVMFSRMNMLLLFSFLIEDSGNTIFFMKWKNPEYLRCASLINFIIRKKIWLVIFNYNNVSVLSSIYHAHIFIHITECVAVYEHKKKKKKDFKRYSKTKTLYWRKVIFKNLFLYNENGYQSTQPTCMTSGKSFNRLMAGDCTSYAISLYFAGIALYLTTWVLVRTTFYCTA